jgi:hypothetical protein
MQIIFLLLAVACFVMSAFPDIREALAKRFGKKKTSHVPSHYWGAYEDQIHNNITDQLELPEPCRKERIPIGGTAYANGRSFNT